MSDRKKVADLPATDMPLHVKYRPKTLGDVFGQGDVKKSLAAALLSRTRPHAYVFTGPAGTGKTTLARIVADMCEVAPENVLEVDAATNSGIDAMRDVLGTVHYKGFGTSVNKCIIVDEAHGLSKQAWDSLLKILEEPPSHVYFVLCTTNPSKVPPTIMSRCARYNVAELQKGLLFDLLSYVCKQERFLTEDKILDIIVRAADGSPRRALTALAMVHDCADEKEAAALLAQPLETRDVIDLCRMIADGTVTWAKGLDVVKSMKDEDPESFRMIVVAYLTSVLLNTTDERKATRLLGALEPFARQPFNRNEKMAPVLLALGDLCLRS